MKAIETAEAKSSWVEEEVEVEVEGKGKGEVRRDIVPLGDSDSRRLLAVGSAEESADRQIIVGCNCPQCENATARSCYRHDGRPLAQGSKCPEAIEKLLEATMRK